MINDTEPSDEIVFKTIKLIKLIGFISSQFRLIINITLFFTINNLSNW